MRRPSSIPLFLLAALFAVATAVYCSIWIYYIRLLPQSTIGVAFPPYSPEVKQLYLVRVSQDSAAERAGLRPGDRIVAINNRPLDDIRPWVDSVLRGFPGSQVAMTVVNAAGVPRQLVVSLPLLPAELTRPTRSQSLIMQSLLSYPLFFLVVGMAVLFVRLEDRNAWLLALMFTGFITLANWVTPEAEPLVPLGVRRFALTYQFLFRTVLPALFYYFFAVFPVPSPLDRRVPWLEYVLVGAIALPALPLAWTVAATGSNATILELSERIRTRFDPAPLGLAYTFGAFLLGFVSLAWNGLSAPTAEARRKTRVLAVGIPAGLAPMLLMTLFVFRSGRDPSPFTLPFSVWVAGVIALLLVPTSFAYAVVKRPVVEIPVLLKRSARYLLVKRGFALFLAAASAAVAWVFVEFFSGFFTGLMDPGPQTLFTTGMAGACVGGLLAVAGARVQHSVGQRLDRAFFRDEYDSRKILEDLADRIRTARSCPELSLLLEEQIRQALHPSSLTIYVESTAGLLAAHGAGAARVVG